MESANMDPELAAEMVKLLGQELKIVRSQLREAEQRQSTSSCDTMSGVHSQCEEALQAELVALKAENVSLRANISSLQGPQAATSVSIKTENDDHSGLIAQYQASMEAIQRELADTIREKNMANSNKEKAIEQLEELTSIREKYRNLKAKKREGQKVIDNLNSQLEFFAEERDRIMSESKPLECDPPSFFLSTSYLNIEEQPNLGDIPVYSNSLSMGIPKVARSKCRCDGTLRFERDVLVFGRPGIALGLILKPMYQYDPRNKGKWDRLPADIDCGQTKDLCYYDVHGWKYLGTYERTGDPTLIAPDNIKKLGLPVVKAIAKQTVLFRDLVSPSQMRMVETMYLEGLLQVETLGIRCVAYNEEFAKWLFKNRKDLPRSAREKAVSTSKKRKRTEIGEYNEGQQEKILADVEDATSTNDNRNGVEPDRSHKRSRKKSSQSGGDEAVLQ